MSTKEERQAEKKQEILDVMQQYKDEKGNVDMTKLRIERRDIYSKIPYYFQSIEGALAQLNAGISNVTEQLAKGGATNRKILRNQLAYDMLNNLRKNHTLEEIAQTYGTTRAHVNQLHKSLEATMGGADESKVEH